MGRRPIDRVLAVARPVLVALLLVVFARAAWYGVRVVLFPWPVDYGEGIVLDQAMSLSRLETIYPADPATPPFVIAHYPPLYTLTQVPFVRIFGPNLWSGRAVSLLSALAAGAFLGGIVHHFTRDRLAAVATALLLLGVPLVRQWAPLYRIDSLALALSTAALLVAARRPRAVVWTSVLLTAAVYTRHSYGLAAPLAAFAYTWRAVSARAALRLALLTGAACLGLFAILTLATDGAFFLHVVEGNLNPHDPAELGYAWGRLAGTVPILLAIGAVFLFVGRRRNPGWWLAAPYLVGGAVVGLTAGHRGAGDNYLYEIAAASVLAAGLALGRNRGALGLALTLALAAQAAVLFISEYPPERKIEWQLSRGAEYAEFARVVEEQPGDLLLGRDMALLPLTGRRIHLHPFLMSLWAATGRWDQAPLLREIADRRFGAIVLRRGRPGDEETCWSPEMLAAIRGSYRLERVVCGREVWVPAP